MWIKFKHTIGALGMFYSGILTGRGDAPPKNMAEVGVLISPGPSPVFDKIGVDETAIPS